MKTVQILIVWINTFGMVINVKLLYAHPYFIFIRGVAFMDFRTNVGFQNIGMVKIVNNTI